jgi:predicted anti-sigma-YlaC factor YlaD
MGMDCTTARQAVSALLDDEPLGVDRHTLEAHLAGCSPCRRWRDHAHLVTRRFRLMPALVTPPARRALTAAAGIGSRRRLREIVLTRAALAMIAVAQVVWVTVPVFLFGDRGAPTHVAHEMGSFDMALAVGFLVAAWRPARAQGMRALVGAAAVLLVGTAIVDLAGGLTSLGDEAPHLLAVAGWLLLRHLAALMPSSGDDRGLALARLVGLWSRRAAAPALSDGITEDENVAGAGRAAEELAA